MQVKSNGLLTTEQGLLQRVTGNLYTLERLSRDCAFFRKDQRRLLIRIPEVMEGKKNGIKEDWVRKKHGRFQRKWVVAGSVFK